MKTKYNKLNEKDVQIGLEVIYHSIIGTDKKIRETTITGDVHTIGNDKFVKVSGASGFVFLEALELKTEYLQRKKLVTY